MTAETQSHLVPKRRFPEFLRVGDWKREQIGNVASIIKGKGLSKADITEGGATPCIRYAELYTHYGEVIHDVVSRTNVPHEDLILSQAEDVIVPASGETRTDIARAACVLLERVALGSDLNILRSDLYGPFLSYVLNSPLRHTIAQMAQGDTVAHLYLGQLSLVWLAYPLRPEQQKIADCLGSLDYLIASEGRKLEALRQHKQGLMQQLFPQPGETQPRLRFPEFADRPEWNGLLLKELEAEGRIELGRGKVISHADMRASPGPYPVYSSSVIDEGLMGTYGDYLFDEELISWSVDGGGHFFYRPKHKFSVTNVSGFMRLLCGDIVCQFLAYQLQRLHASQTFDYQQKAHPSVIRTLYAVGLPEPDEQRRISDCLASLDARMVGQTRRVDALKQHKQGLMQQLFPSLEQGPK